jgi:hypothetical protein
MRIFPRVLMIFNLNSLISLALDNKDLALIPTYSKTLSQPMRDRKVVGVFGLKAQLQMLRPNKVLKLFKLFLQLNL